MTSVKTMDRWEDVVNCAGSIPKPPLVFCMGIMGAAQFRHLEVTSKSRSHAALLMTSYIFNVCFSSILKY